jgi:hypothetical protein
VWFDPLNGLRAFDLNEQRLGTQQVLTWWQGVVVDGHGVGTDVIMNRAYKVIAMITGGNGFQPDLHDFQLEADGVAYVTSYQAVKWNMTPDRGAADGTAWDGIVQEIDVKTGLVMYEWHSLDHVSVGLSELAAPSHADAILDYFRVNSIQPLADGHLLISARNTSAIYNVAPGSGGDIDWELGGKESPGSMFWFQHDARELSPRVISLFDDEAAPEKASESRALELKINVSDHSATVLKMYDPPTKLLGVALTVAMTTRPTMSSTTVTVRMNPRSRAGALLPTRARMPSENAVSVDIACPPAVNRWLPGVEDEVDADRTDHPSNAGKHRQHDSRTITELADVELAASLEADDEEEEGHQPAVDPAAQVHRDGMAGERDRQVRVPNALV